MEVIFVMSESNNYIVSVEVLKYPYCGKSIESEEFLSEKSCYSTIKVRKKIIKGIKWDNSISSNWVTNSDTDYCDYEIYSFKC